MIEMRRIQGNSREDANIPNQPFSLWGRMIPSLQDGRWDCRIEKSETETETEMCFPDYAYFYRDI